MEAWEKAIRNNMQDDWLARQAGNNASSASKDRKQSTFEKPYPYPSVNVHGAGKEDGGGAANNGGGVVSDKDGGPLFTKDQRRVEVLLSAIECFHISLYIYIYIYIVPPSPVFIIIM